MNLPNSALFQLITDNNVSVNVAASSMEEAIGVLRNIIRETKEAHAARKVAFTEPFIVQVNAVPGGVFIKSLDVTAQDASDTKKAPAARMGDEGQGALENLLAFRRPEGPTTRPA